MVIHKPFTIGQFLGLKETFIINSQTHMLQFSCVALCVGIIRGPNTLLSLGQPRHLWWRKPIVDLKPAWERDEPLKFVYVEVPPAAPMEQLGAIVPVPPADEDATDDDAGGGGIGGGGPFGDVNENDDDDPLAIEDAPAQPRMS